MNWKITNGVYQIPIANFGVYAKDIKVECNNDVHSVFRQMAQMQCILLLQQLCLSVRQGNNLQCCVEDESGVKSKVIYNRSKQLIKITNITIEQCENMSAQNSWSIANNKEVNALLAKAENELKSDKVYEKMKQAIKNAQQSPCKSVDLNENVEQLKWIANNLWSRRVNNKHRLVYYVYEDKQEIKIISVCGHFPKTKK